jgi:hypothetical protein
MEKKNYSQEVFDEVLLFGEVVTGTGESGDCSCFSCDGNPCDK